MRSLRNAILLLMPVLSFVLCSAFGAVRGCSAALLTPCTEQQLAESTAGAQTSPRKIASLVIAGVEILDHTGAVAVIKNTWKGEPLVDIYASVAKAPACCSYVVNLLFCNHADRDREEIQANGPAARPVAAPATRNRCGSAHRTI